MKGRLLRNLILVINVLIIWSFAPLVDAEQVPRMTKEQLRPLLGNADVLILDVRASRDWSRGGRKIKGAVRENPKRFKTWAHKYSKEKTLVLYCA